MIICGKVHTNNGGEIIEAPFDEVEEMLTEISGDTASREGPFREDYPLPNCFSSLNISYPDKNIEYMEYIIDGQGWRPYILINSIGKYYALTIIDRSGADVNNYINYFKKCVQIIYHYVEDRFETVSLERCLIDKDELNEKISYCLTQVDMSQYNTEEYMLSEDFDEEFKTQIISDIRAKSNL